MSKSNIGSFIFGVIAGAVGAVVATVAVKKYNVSKAESKQLKGTWGRLNLGRGSKVSRLEPYYYPYPFPNPYYTPPDLTYVSSDGIGHHHGGGHHGRGMSTYYPYPYPYPYPLDIVYVDEEAEKKKKEKKKSIFGKHHGHGPTGPRMFRYYDYPMMDMEDPALFV